MNIQLNGESFQCATNINIVQLLEQLQLLGKRIAIEVNQEVIPRSEHASYIINNEDVVEVVHAIGGG